MTKPPDTASTQENSPMRIADKVATVEEESGTQIITLSDETRKEIREAYKECMKRFAKVIQPQIYNAYMDKE